MAIDIVSETHLTSEDKERGVASGWAHSRLSAIGRDQASALGERRRDDGLAVVFAAVDVVAMVAGNTERYVLTGDRPDPSVEDVAADPTLLPRLVEVAGSFACTRGAAVRIPIACGGRARYRRPSR